MTSRIQELIPKYGKFEDLLPEELKKIDFNQLKSFKDEFKVITHEELDAIKKLTNQNNVILDPEKFREPEYVIRMGFYRENDTVQEAVHFCFSHWYMSMVTLDILTNAVIELSSVLINYYDEYTNEKTTVTERKFKFNQFVRTWQDFNGYLINIKQTIYDYCDLYARTCNAIDPNFKVTPYYAFKSDTTPDELHSAVKELLLHGNMGRVAGFSLLRSMIEITVVGKVLDLQNSPKYKNNTIEFNNDYPLSVNSVCNAINRIAYANLFKTDTIIRLYNWQSKVSHVGLRSDEYLTWFVRIICARLCNLFSRNIDSHRDKILDDLKRKGQIKVKS